VKLTRRRFLVSSSGAALSLGITVKLVRAAPVVSDVWMETPTTLAVQVFDDPITPGNIVTSDTPYADALGTWVQKTNPRSGNLEYCSVIGSDRKSIRFSDLPPANYIDRVAFFDKTNYLITGGSGLTVTALYHRTEFYGQGQYQIGRVRTLGVAGRLTAYLELASAPVSGTTYTIHHSTGAFADKTFTYNDKAIRAGGIKATMGGHRTTDAFKYAYLCSRLPGAPNHGVVDFATTYGISDFHLIDNSGSVVFDGSIVLRRLWSDLETAGFTNTIDVADLAQGWTITNVTTTGNPTVLTFAGGHGFAPGDKIRFDGISGATELQSAASGGNSNILYTAYTVTSVSGNDVTVPISTTHSLTTTTYNVALGGILNKAYKCFPTNRAATSVWGLDYSFFTTPGTYRIWIPNYGVSDPILFDEAAHANSAALHHKGWYSLRLGCATPYSSYKRGSAFNDGDGGLLNYWSLLPAQASSEISGGGGGAFTGRVQAGLAGYTIPIKVGGVTQAIWGTSTRAVGSRPGHQDAGDNDDILSDHIGGINYILAVFKQLPKPSRFLPFTVQLSTEVCDPTLFVGTDDLPPVFHEIAWYLEAYRTMQQPDGSIPGGYSPAFFSTGGIHPAYPQPIDYFTGTDPIDNTALSGPMGCFLYASDHHSAFGYAQAAAQFAFVCYDYGLTTLGDTYKASAIAAYAWADAIVTSTTVRDAYYNGVLGLQTKMFWDAATYSKNLATLDSRATTQKNQAACALYRLLGSVDGQTPYGNVIDVNYSGFSNSFGAWDYINTPGAKAKPKTYMLGHMKDQTDNSIVATLSDTVCFRSLGTNTVDGGNIIRAHWRDILSTGIDANRSSKYLKVLQSGLHFIEGANMQGKSAIVGHGPRHTEIVLHEDSYSAGQPSPEGITPFGYNPTIWATNLMKFNFATGPNCDSGSNYISANITGIAETPPSAGSKHLWHPWQQASGLWEWAPENKGLIFQSEYAFVSTMIPWLAISLYLHGWDGNAI
jgi:endoglucanase